MSSTTANSANDDQVIGVRKNMVFCEGDSLCTNSSMSQTAVKNTELIATSCNTLTEQVQGVQQITEVE